MKYSFKILFLTILLVGSLGYSQQVNVVISEVKLNNLPIPNGTPVQLGTSSSGMLKFRLDVIKPNDLTVGSVLYSIGTITSTGTFTLQRPVESLYLGTGNTGSTGYYEFELFDSDLDFGGGCYLTANVGQIVSPNVPATPLLNWNSNQVSLKKTPTYTINSNASSVQCGSTTPVIFTVNSNAPSNYNTYQWSFGSGWTISGGTTGNTLTLIPGSTPLSVVSVTPTFSGVVQPSKSFTITRAPISNTLTINGSANICTGNSTYTLAGLLAGQSISSWSISDTSIATINTTTASTITVTKVGSGTVTLTAVITNACGQTKNITKV